MDLSLFLKNKNEKPLDKILSNGGLCSILRTVVCVGDSLSSGEFEGLHKNDTKTYHDMFDYSWGQFIARMAGIKVYNYSRGGMTAEEYCESYANKKGWWNEDIKANAYIIALAVNDVNGKLPLGDISDIDKNDFNNNKKTFIGYYAKIIQKYKMISPDAKFFLITTPYLPDCKKDAYDKVSNLFYALADLFDNIYIIDLKKYGPDYTDKEFIDNFFLNNHLSPSGYYLTAKMVASYIDYIIRNNPNDFKLLGFQNTEIIKDLK